MFLLRVPVLGWILNQPFFRQVGGQVPSLLDLSAHFRAVLDDLFCWARMVQWLRSSLWRESTDLVVCMAGLVLMSFSR